MRFSAVFAGLAALSNTALAAVYAGGSSSVETWAASSSAATYGSSASYTPIQQIGDGQIQNPATPAPATYGTPVPSYYAPSPSVVPAPVVSPASHSNYSAVVTTPKSMTSAAYYPTTPVAPVVTASKPPAVQTGAANALVGSTAGMGFVALVAALLG